MKKHLLILPVTLLFFFITGFGQDVPDKDPDQERAELQKKAVEYLRETASQVNTLRTNENRISFSAELANLMWFNDEKEARKMFLAVADDFIQLLTDYNSRVEAYGGSQGAEDIFGGSGLGGDSRGEAVRKLYRAGAVREQVALAVAEHDPQLSYDFVLRSSLVVTDKVIGAQFAEQNENLENQIIERMAAQDVDKSLAFGRSSLKRGFNPSLISLAKKIYQKDPEAAIEFGKEIVDKVRSEAKPESASIENMYSVLSEGGSMLDELEDGKTPLFEKQSLASLAELFADNLVKTEDFSRYMLDEYVAKIEKYSPSQAIRVRTKFPKKNDEDKSDLEMAFEAAAPKTETSPESPESLSPEQAAEQAREEERQLLMAELQEFGNDGLSSSEKAKFIGRARRIVGEIDEPTVKILALTSLASRVKYLGDKELASDIMREANALVKPNPNNYLDYLLVWSLVSGYAMVEPESAFPLLEDTIYRLNDTIGAFVKVAEFIDVRNDFTIDGEVQVGAFGGSMTRNLVGMLDSAGPVLKSLAMSDFDRTKALADKFDKPEVRILARFLVLRSVLNNGESEDIGLVN